MIVSAALSAGDKIRQTVLRLTSDPTKEHGHHDQPPRSAQRLVVRAEWARVQEEQEERDDGDEGQKGPAEKTTEL